MTSGRELTIPRSLVYDADRRVGLYILSDLPRKILRSACIPLNNIPPYLKSGYLWSKQLSVVEHYLDPGQDEEHAALVTDFEWACIGYTRGRDVNKDFDNFCKAQREERADGYHVPTASAEWSRQLREKIRATQERERLTVMIQVQDADEI